MYFYFRLTFEERVRRKYFKDLIPPITMADLFPVSSPDLINLFLINLLILFSGLSSHLFDRLYQLAENDEWSAALKFKIDKLYI
jgi:hypothetical protein